MGIISFPSITRGMTADQLGDVLARVIKDLQYVLDGNISSTNVREIAGYKVGVNELKHKSGIVGMNGGDPTNPNAIRYWAGDANPAIAPYRVTQGGILTAIGAQFQSSSGYPRVEINSTSNLIAAYLTPNDAIRVVPNFSGGNPAMYFTTGGSTVGYLQDFGSVFGLLTPFGVKDIQIGSGKSLFLTANNGIEMTCAGIRINGNIGVSGTVYVSSISGGAATTPITFTNGIRTA